MPTTIKIPTQIPALNISAIRLQLLSTELKNTSNKNTFPVFIM